MKNIKILIGLVAILFNISAAMAASPQVILTGHNNPHISIVDLETKSMVWQIDVDNKKGEQCNSVHLINNGEYIAYTTQYAVKVVSIATKELIYKYEIETRETEEVHSIIPRKDGGVSIFLGGNPAKIVELDKEFKQINTIEFTAAKKKPHSQFRQCCITKKGNYLVPIFGKKQIIEINKKGRIIKTHDIDGDAFSVREMNNGNLILGMGNAPRVIEYNPKKGTIVNELSKADDIEVLYMAQVEQVDKDCILVANWKGHFKRKLVKPVPPIFFLNSKLEMVSAWDNNDLDIGKISAFCYSKDKIIK